MTGETDKDKELSFGELKEVSGGYETGLPNDHHFKEEKKIPLDDSGRKFVNKGGVPFAIDETPTESVGNPYISPPPD